MLQATQGSKPCGGVAVGGCAINVVLVLVAVVKVVVVSVATRKAAKMIHFNANLDSTSSTDCSKERERGSGREGGTEGKENSCRHTHAHAARVHTR